MIASLEWRCSPLRVAAAQPVNQGRCRHHLANLLVHCPVAHVAHVAKWHQPAAHVDHLAKWHLLVEHLKGPHLAEPVVKQEEPPTAADQ